MCMGKSPSKTLGPPWLIAGGREDGYLFPCGISPRIAAGNRGEKPLEAHVKSRLSWTYPGMHNAYLNHGSLFNKRIADSKKRRAVTFRSGAGDRQTIGAQTGLGAGTESHGRVMPAERASWNSQGWSLGLCLMGLVIGLMTACEKAPEEATGASRSTSPPQTTVLRLKPEAVAAAGIEVRPVVRGKFQLHREFPATVQPNENELAAVTTLVRGRVVEVYVDFGADVKKGTPLALLHSTDLGLAEASYLKAGARLHEAELAFERARDLLEHKAISLAEFQKREAEVKTARAEAREGRSRLDLLGVPAQEIQRLDREHTIRPDVSLRSPFAGRVILRDITRGEVVETTQKLFTVADLSDVWVVGNVPEKDVRFVHRDQPMEARVSAYPDEVFQGKVTYVGDVLDPATRTMRVRVTVPNPDRRLKPEMFATVRMYSSSPSEVLTIPLAAVQRDGRGTMVFVQLDPQQFEARPVKLGEERGDVVAVLGGLQEGEQVVIKGAFVLKSEAEKHKIEPAR